MLSSRILLFMWPFGSLHTGPFVGIHVNLEEATVSASFARLPEDEAELAKGFGCGNLDEVPWGTSFPSNVPKEPTQTGA